jgi:L-ascorbate metabolism protein UlaG (beta-lactamase superfamily)
MPPTSRRDMNGCSITFIGTATTLLLFDEFTVLTDPDFR